MAFFAALAPLLAGTGKALASPATASVLGGLGLASSIPFYFGAGQPSEEDQERMLRRQLEIQDEFEQQRAARMGGGMEDLGGLVGGGRRSLSDLVAEDDMLAELERVSYDLDRADRARGSRDSELERIIGGQSARIAALQSQRTLTPIEVIQMMEMIGG